MYREQPTCCAASHRPSAAKWKTSSTKHEPVRCTKSINRIPPPPRDHPPPPPRPRHGVTAVTIWQHSVQAWFAVREQQGNGLGDRVRQVSLFGYEDCGFNT